MSCLSDESDRVVREAVDAYLEGRFAPALETEMAFDTKNSRYRLMDGVLFSASDSSLIGAELVGWLVEMGSAQIKSSWCEGSRAVLVDRNRAQHIIVTSTTRSVTITRGASSSDRLREDSVPRARFASNPDRAPSSPRIPALPPSPARPTALPIRPSSPPSSRMSAPVHPPPRPIRALPPPSTTRERPLPPPLTPPRAQFVPPPPPSGPYLGTKTIEDEAVETERDPTERHDRASLPMSGFRDLRRPQASSAPDSGPATLSPITKPTASSEPIPLAQRRSAP